jgi:hypothetical protein
MKAIGYDTTGSVDVLVDIDLPKPKPQPNDLLVEVRAISVNPVDAPPFGPRSPIPSLTRLAPLRTRSSLKAAGRNARAKIPKRPYVESTEEGAARFNRELERFVPSQIAKALFSQAVDIAEGDKVQSVYLVYTNCAAVFELLEL